MAIQSSETSKLESHAVSVNMWHQRFAHMYTKDGRESHYNPSVESSDDSDDDSSPNQPQPLTPVRPAPKAPQRRPNVQEIPPYVSSRRKPVSVSTTPLKPTSSKGFNRAPIPNKPGWERVEVQRQSGATKGKWDIYFYAPGCKIPLRSRPELRDYCEQALTEMVMMWLRPQETDIDADSDPECYTVRNLFIPKGWERKEVERVGGASAGYSDVYYYSPDGTKLKSRPEVQLYCTLQKPQLSIQTRDYNLSRAFSFLPRFSQDGACEVLLPINKLFYMFGPLSAAAESLYAAEEVRKVTSPVPRRSARIEVHVRQPEAARPTCGWNLARIPYIVPQQSTIRCTFGFHLIA
uniref:MBD domain-containing protein n=1 Tax=Strigamia maritima TaxID=126957 RepID=T1IJT7_STRMM